MPGSEFLTLSNITKHFGPKDNRTYALRDVSLSVNTGEVLLLMGPSGSGKTTLLSIMGCILQPSEGTISIDGTDISGMRSKDLGKVRLDNLGFVFQEYNLFPTLNAINNIQVALNLRGMNKKQSHDLAMQSLEAVGLADKAKAMPDTLSGGQKQRLAIARALAGQPKVILADEPTAALDSANGRMVVDLMASLAKTGDRAVVIVTHDPRTLEFADRIVTIEDGRLLDEQHSADPSNTR